ncbi:type I-F CRISPR-associated protein Csy1 [Pseudomonas gingeri]|uniref:type I-F CRISPR-associated protein Csy1 n=1 Tax=Pseudomonas gingeri TaxID=117681 RepID=UPI0015A15D75|nr:type I-F CRISPR-associated protein Csy1 [Pseudomonas gingeri]NVZ99211.1 type I-F CRISPR-associated protein Csy1 [Pseudomonas gingeri]NWA13256.1 type I-F CRISPR-associated protein Csy1 [Pseudomonas gingeri]NWA55517.1 type I-F CRISPR-associated protein Csy1 [Pseudomonas gingeri]NWA95629.1 type I-F CRISPR-associated protein Csy1 [Pseudomonas gingeri]NWB00716.1 type I-F CRISPR-associated protein Csy1 [Pseudomonas gingeri]
MDETSDQIPRTTRFRSAIAAFIDERKDAKLKDAEGDGAQAAKYEYGTWLADAARRVTQIQAVTHVLKATHPDARGSSLHIPPESLPSHAEIGTHVLGDQYADDIVGNAAALDVYKFLKREVDGKRLLDWFLLNDADLLAALHNDEATALEWATAFKSLIRPASVLASHGLAKQVYWCLNGDPTDDTDFQLLQPLFASSLAHAVHQDIQSARFGETNKLARQARRKQEPHEGVYRDYRNLVMRKLGGTKPQNISQLNSDRGGTNYLLASLPPIWDQDRPRNFLKIESALERFHHYPGVREQLQALFSLLERDPAAIKETRDRRKQIEETIVQSLAAFGLASREIFRAGWSRDPECKLPLCEQLWLDPDRISLPPREDHLEEDQAFVAAFAWKDWPDQVAQRFGLWLNAILRERKLPVGDVEQKNWAKQAIIEAESPMPFKASVIPADNKQEVTHG